MDNIKLPEEFYITKENLSELLPKFNKCIESAINHSWEFQQYLKYINQKYLITFPIPLSMIIRITATDHINLNKKASTFDISKDVLEKLFRGEIPYLSFNDKRSYTRVREAIEYINSSTSRNHSDFYNNEVFPLVNEHLTMQQVDVNWLKKAINSIYGEDEVCDEYNAYMLFWIKYCKYRGVRFF